MDETVEVWTVKVDADTSALRQELSNATRYGRQFSTSLADAFVGLTGKGKSLGEVVSSLALSLSKIALQSAFQPLTQGLGSWVAGLSGGTGAVAQGFANGGVISRGLPVPFASGGVVRSPVAFPLGNGRTGLMGERGAEAILPLARGPDGRLGVRSDAASSPSIVFNVQATDVESFRRSQTQIGAMLARTVERGRRNM